MSPTITADTISWNQVDNDPDTPCVRKYELQYEGGHCNLTQQYNLSASNVSSVPVETLELEMGAVYAVRVRSVNLFTSGDWSGTEMLYTPSTR